MALFKSHPRKRNPSTRPFRESEELLSALEEQRLANRWRIFSDAHALRRLISAHIVLVKRIAMEFRTSGPPIDDLLQEGYLGLTIAARRFDPNRNTRLATYAAYWIRACMLELVVRSYGPVRIGTTRCQRKIFFGMGRARRALEKQSEPIDRAHLAAYLEVDEREVEAMASRLSGRDVYLDAPVQSLELSFTQTHLVDEHPSPEDVLSTSEEIHLHENQLREGLKTLKARERAIIQSRYLDPQPATLANLGVTFGISRERVRQIELRALSKLRAFVEPLDTRTAA